MLDQAPSPASPPSAEPSRDPAGGCACGAAADHERRERHARVLQELTELSLKVARVTAAQAAGEAPVPEGMTQADAARALDRVSRSLRLNLVLEEKLAKAHAKRAAEGAAQKAEAAKAAAEDREGQREYRRDEVMRVLERTIRVDMEDERAIDTESFRIIRAISERLEDEDRTPDLLDQAVGEIVARACRDVGITPELSFWADERRAFDAAIAQLPGPPFLHLRTMPDMPPILETGDSAPPLRDTG